MALVLLRYIRGLPLHTFLPVSRPTAVPYLKAFDTIPHMETSQHTAQ